MAERARALPRPEDTVGIEAVARLVPEPALTRHELYVGQANDDSPQRHRDTEKDAMKGKRATSVYLDLAVSFLVGLCVSVPLW
jgi:hypothetical protein